MGETGSCSGGRGRARKRLIRFSPEGWGCAPFLSVICLTPSLESTGGLKSNSKRTGQQLPPRTAAASAPVPTAGHCGPTPLQETLRHVQAGLAQALVTQGVLLLFLCLFLPLIFNFSVPPPLKHSFSSNPLQHVFLIQPVSLCFQITESNSFIFIIVLVTKLCPSPW